ncbi:MAG: site-2 protease family protein [Desulfovibrio sp.]|jgi:Zn-dependent protease|nr:site-2 protease family protein [Desulfovibrio sp.]
MHIQDSLTTFGLAFVPALFGIICHEVAHGWMADKLGDPTAKRLGRLTLNPIKHIDPVGLGVFVVTVLLMPFGIGWAKPVPVQSRYFKHPREGMVFVALAGPMANMLVALLCAIIIKVTYNLENAGLFTSALPLDIVQSSAKKGIGINCALAWFNLMPVPPLDGSHVVGGLLPASFADRYQSMGRYGMIIIMILLASGMFGQVLVPLIHQTRKLIMALVGI